MAHANEDRVREGFAAFQQGDLEKVKGLFTDDIVWHVPGKSPLAGTYKGKEEVLGFFAKTMEMTGGSFTIDVHDVLANDEHGTALITTRGEREGRSLTNNAVQVFHLRDGMVAESWVHPEDMYAVDEFWS